MWNTYSDPTRKCVCAHVLDSYLLHGGMHGPVGVATLVCMGSCTDQGLWFCLQVTIKIREAVCIMFASVICVVDKYKIFTVWKFL